MTILYRLDCCVDDVEEARLIALRNGEFVGTVGLRFRGRSSACIRQLFVHPDARRRRVGTTLVEEACKIAFHGRCETIGLSLALANRGLAEDFYKPLGFYFGYEYDDGSCLLVKDLAAFL